MTKVYAVKCLVKNEFKPAYESYSSYEEVTYLVPYVESEDESIVRAKVANHLQAVVEDCYVNADGVWKQNRLFYIAGFQEVDAEVNFDSPALEVYRWFYTFERLVSEEEFLNLYYFDDLGR